MSTQTDKIRERLQDAKDRIDNMLASVDTGIHENDLHDTESDIDEALAALSELEAQPSEPRLKVDQLREEMELLGSMIQAERSTATEANRQCTDEQLERCYQLGDRLAKAAQ